MGQRNFKKPFEFHSFSEIFRNINLGVFTKSQYTRNILRNKNMGQRLYCGMTRLRSTTFNYCGLCKEIKPNRVQESFKTSKFQYSIKFLTDTWPNAGTNGGMFLENIFT